jgi:putative hydrolase of the HAD superfamily
MADHWHAEFGRCAQPATDLDVMLAALSDRGMRIGVVTNSTRAAVQNAKIDTVGIRQHLDSVVVSETAGFEKPDKRIFQMALAELGLEPNQAWFVGDNPVKDILGASAVGLPPVWKRGNLDWPEEHDQPDLQIDSLEELLPLVDGRAAR